MDIKFLESKRFVLTAECKISAFLAKKFKSFWTMELLRKKLEKRDNLLCREAKFCMNKVVDWQRRAQKCIVAKLEKLLSLCKEYKGG